MLVGPGGRGARQGFPHGEAVPGQPDGGGGHLLEAQAAVPPLQHGEAPRLTRHGHRQGAKLGQARDHLAGLVQEHPGVGRCRGGLPEVQRHRIGPWPHDDREAAAPQPTGVGLDHTGRQGRGHRGVHGVAPRAQHGGARLAGQLVIRGHHPRGDPGGGSGPRQLALSAAEQDRDEDERRATRQRVDS